MKRNLVDKISPVYDSLDIQDIPLCFDSKREAWKSLVINSPRIILRGLKPTLRGGLIGLAAGQMLSDFMGLPKEESIRIGICSGIIIDTIQYTGRNAYSLFRKFYESYER